MECGIGRRCGAPCQARVFVQSGEHERALDLIEPLLSVAGSDLTPGYLELDPTFKPLAGNPRFQRLIGQR